MMRTGWLGFNHEKWLMVLITNHISKKTETRHFVIFTTFEYYSWKERGNFPNTKSSSSSSISIFLTWGSTKVTADPSLQAQLRLLRLALKKWSREEEEKKFIALIVSNTGGFFPPPSSGSIASHEELLSDFNAREFLYYCSLSSPL